MNDKITTARLAAMLAISTGKQKKLCEDFIKELFALVEEELLNGENVRIKGFGTFKLVDVEPRKSVNVATGEETLIPGHSKVIFVAAKELASAVNLPFEAFEAVEIADALPTDSLDGDEEPDEEFDGVVETAAAESIFRPEQLYATVGEADDAAAEDDALAEEVEEELTSMGNAAEDTAADAICDIPAEREAAVEAAECPASPDIEEEGTQYCEEEVIKAGVGKVDDTEDESEEDSSEPVEYDYTDSEQEEKTGGKRFAKGFATGFVAALVVGILIFGISYFCGFSFGGVNGKKVAEAKVETVITDNDNAEAKVAAESVAANVTTDSVTSAESTESDDAVPTKSSDEQVYDTVSTTRYLTTIAKEHYGNFNLWPIIYEENKDILGHPDRIRPGTKVVVPPLSKYGIDPENKDQIKAVKEKGKEIYARFK